MLPLSAEHIPRAAQLTLRTNQFNTTTLRYTQGELLQLLSEGNDGAVVRVRDRFGDYGFVGLVLFRENDDIITLQSFLLSCRALGRGVEHQMLGHILEVARKRKRPFVDVPFAATAKNEPARRFLQAVGGHSSDDSHRVLFHIPAATPIVFDPAGDESVPGDYPKPVRSQAGASVASAVWNQIATQWSNAQDVSHAVDASVRSARRSATSAYSAPTSRAETILAKIWQEVLGIDLVGIEDDYFELGGDSIQAVAISSRARLEGLAVSLAHVLELPTIKRLAAGTAQASGARAETAHAVLPQATRVPSDLSEAEDIYPVSSAQAFMLRHYARETTDKRDLAAPIIFKCRFEWNRVRNH